MNSEKYQCILTDFIVLLDNTREEQKGWIQQNNTKARISDLSMMFIRKFFEGGVISVGL